MTATAETTQRAEAPLPTAYQRVEDNERYLRSKSWHWLGCDDRGVSFWEDPLSQDPKKSEVRPACTLPVPGGGTEVVMQTFVPPCNWRHRTDNAVLIQRSRDAAGQTIDQQIEAAYERVTELEAVKAARQAAAAPATAARK